MTQEHFFGFKPLASSIWETSADNALSMVHEDAATTRVMSGRVETVKRSRLVVRGFEQHHTSEDSHALTPVSLMVKVMLGFGLRQRTE